MRYELNRADPLVIPDWLRVDAAEAKRRAAWWVKNPPKPMPAFNAKAEERKLSPELAAQLAEAEERKATRSAAKAAGKRASAKQLEALKPKDKSYERLRAIQKVIEDARIAARAKGLPPLTLLDVAVLCEKFHGRAVSVAVHPVAKKMKRGAPAAKASPVREAKVRAAKRANIGKTSETKTMIWTMVERPEGATLAELAAATGTMEHSCSATLSGIRKTRTIEASVEARGRVYRMKPE